MIHWNMHMIWCFKYVYVSLYICCMYASVISIWYMYIWYEAFYMHLVYVHDIYASGMSMCIWFVASVNTLYCCEICIWSYICCMHLLFKYTSNICVHLPLNTLMYICLHILLLKLVICTWCDASDILHLFLAFKCCICFTKLMLLHVASIFHICFIK